mmetsp:Transcript_6614/g.16204  ORF Transcript_6614/g.16204 Transcript_6614/m.16204 type:complete len:121 (-) Transcript_6614:42-404(-)
MGNLPGKFTKKDTANRCTLLVEQGKLSLRKDSPHKRDVAPEGANLSNEQWQQIQQVVESEFVKTSSFAGPPFGKDPHKDKAYQVMQRLQSQYGLQFTYMSFWDNYHIGGKCWCYCITVQW